MLALVCLFAAISAQGQTPPAPTAPSAPAAAPAIPPPAPQPSAARAAIDGLRSQLDQMEATLKRPDLSDDMLRNMRLALEPHLEALRGIIEDTSPRADALRARLALLGPRPDAAQPEAPDIARERAERERAVKEADDTLGLARTLLAQGQEIATDLADRRRSLFAAHLLERSTSPLNPLLWWEIAKVAPRDVEAFSLTMSDWWSAIVGAEGWSRWLPALLGILAALALLFPVTRFVERYAMRREGVTPGRGAKAFRAGVILLLGVVRPILAGWLVYAGFEAAGMLPGRVAPIFFSALAAVAVVAVARAVGQAFFAPDAPNWRLPDVSDASAAALKATFVQATSIHVAGRVIETINRAIGAGLPLTIATRAIFALLFAAVAWRILSLARVQDPSEEACLGPYVPPAVTLAGPARAALAVALVIVIGAALLGYVALAVFIIDQILWLSLLAIALRLALITVDESVASLLATETRITRALSESVGLRSRSIEQLAVIASGLLKLLICIAAAMMAITPLGVQSTDIFAPLRAALFGFQIGGVTISLSAIVASLAIFAGGVFLTRSSQRWLDDKFLPHTDLDAGLRNSIRTVIGYAGLVVAAALAVSSFGFSLDRIAIVAGALSVGIGFGLQSVVNNFVSGLILLWERPIRVGDLIVVGDEQGYVRRINVRSTEVETFDRSTVILPNSNLVSGIVKNRVHTDRTGRVLISICVPRLSDPHAVEQIMLDAASRHPDVMKKPAPRVAFKKIGETVLDFDLICFVSEVEIASRVSSDLHFAIFPALASAQIAAAAQTVNVEGIDRLEESLDQIAEAIEDRDDGREAKEREAKEREAKEREEKERAAAAPRDSKRRTAASQKAPAK
ncbi:MAG: DUF3772 domain-containing protein [Beijerinckiaceae bacterium]